MNIMFTYISENKNYYTRKIECKYIYVYLKQFIYTKQTHYQLKIKLVTR